jgi:hypothetical protein
MSLAPHARQRIVILMAALFAAALALYLRTLVPGVFVSDFVEFQYQPLRLGLPHPNGFPSYMLLGWLWSHLPIETVAWRMNALSAFGGALAVSVTAGFVHRLTGRAAAGLLAGGLVMASPTFWYYALAAERYTLNLALLAGAWWAAWESAQRQEIGRAARCAYLSAFLLALGLTLHPSDALIVPFWLLFVIWRLPKLRDQLRFWLRLALAAGLPLLLYLYVPLRWAAFADWPLLPGIGRSSAIYQGMTHVWYEPELRFDLIGRYILGLGSYVASLATGGWQDALRNLWQVTPYWLHDVPWPLLVVAGLGAVGLWQTDCSLALALGGFSVLLVLMIAYITQGKNDAYLLPAFWAVFFCAGLAIDVVLAGLAVFEARLGGGCRAGRPRLRAAPAAVLLVVAIVLGLIGLRYPAADRSRAVESPQTWAVNLMHPLEPGAGLLGHWSDLTPLWYIQQIEGRHTDLVGLFPPDSVRVIEPWLQAGRALYMAAPLQEWALDLPARYDLMSWGRLVRILPKGAPADCPPLAQAIQTPAAWPLEVQRWDVDPILGGEMPGALRFCWQARTALARETFLRVRLRPVGGGSEIRLNEPLISTWYPLREVGGSARGYGLVPLRLPQGAAPGRYTLDLMPYLLRDDGPAAWPGVEPIVFDEVRVSPSRSFDRHRLIDETAPIVAPRAGPLALRAWRVSREAVRPGDPVQVELLWEALAPPRGPITLSLAFRDIIGGQQVRASRLDPLILPAEAQDAGVLIRSMHSLAAPRGRGDRLYLVELRVQAGQRWLAWSPTFRLVVGAVQTRDRPHVTELPERMQPRQAAFGSLSDLAGTTPLPEHLEPGGTLSLTLAWRVRAETERSYAVFLHLVDGQGQIVAQHDGAPAQGTLPTSLWLANEIIVDAHTLELPATLAAGRYTLRIGLYDPATGERLPVVSDLPVTDRAVEIAAWEMTP